MKKMYYILILCLYSIAVFSQKASSRISADYILESITITTHNTQTKAMVSEDVINIDDPASLALLYKLPISIQPVFSSAQVVNGVLKSCTLFNNGKSYYVVDGNKLELKDGSNNKSLPEYDIFPSGYAFSLLWGISFSGNKMIFTVKEIYGSSQYNFTAESVLSVTLIKDTANKTTL